MKKADSRTRHHVSQEVAHALSAWWTRPDPDSTALWASPVYARQVRAAWKAEVNESVLAGLDMLLAVVGIEEDTLAAEYERLFVGPAAVPCPPYEVMWRTDRPQHERGMIVGQSTDEIKRLYGRLGLRLRPEQVELPDHIEIELEALAYASGASGEIAESIRGHLRAWLPGFCESVIANSQVGFYRCLAGVTLESLCGGSEQTAYSGMPLIAKSKFGTRENHTGEKR